MKYWTFWCRLWLSLALVPGALAQEADADMYLLGDLGVRVDLPDTWSPQSGGWADWFFKGQMIKEPVQLWVWATPIQTPAGSDPEAWMPVYEARIEEGGGRDARYVDGSVKTIRGMRVALLEVAYESASLKREVHLFGATMAVQGQTLHMATLALPENARRAQDEHLKLLERLDIRKPAISFTPGQTMELEGFSFPLPTGWRVPLANEEEAVLAHIQHLPTGPLNSCALAMRAHAGAEPDALVACQKSHTVGVLDAYSADRLGDAMAGTLFKAYAETMAHEGRELKDRWGWLFTPRETTGSFALAVVPNDQGVAMVWAASEQASAGLEEVVWEAAEAAEHQGAARVSVGAQIQYRLFDRTGSAATLGGLLVAVLILAGLGWGARGLFKPRKNPYALDDDEF